MKQKTPRETMRYAVDVQRRTGDIATQMFGWARACDTVKHFLALCVTEEQWVKSAAAGQHQVDTLPTCWTQAKSDIKAAWSRGLEPKDFESYHKLKAAKVKRGKASGLVTQEREPGPAEATVTEALEAGTVIDPKAGIPDDLKEIEALIRPLNQLSRARVIKDMTALAHKARAEHDASTAKGKSSRRRGKVGPPLIKVA